MLHAFAYGLLLAFGLIIPLGIQNIFIFNQGATQQPYYKAMPSVIAAALCDTLLILLAVLGVSAAVFKIAFLKEIILFCGSIFLIYMGWLTWRTHSSTQDSNRRPLSFKQQISFAVSVSLLNPHALIDTIAVIGTNALLFNRYEKWFYGLACILISWLWFFGLSLAGHFLHRLDNSESLMQKINKFSAIIIWGVAGNMIYQLFYF
jgi:L-lysine exporter family protein LysE/ArgO